MGMSAIIKHHKEAHPKEKYFGDSIEMKDGEIVSHRCQLCGKELVEKKEVKDGLLL